MEIVDNIAIKFSIQKEIAEDVLKSVEKSERLQASKDYSDILMYWEHSEVVQATMAIDRYRPNKVPTLPSPILRDYNWPGIHVPMAHQKDTANFLSVRPRAFCFNEAGTGKTSSCIWAADYLMKIGVVRRVLVICPLSIMIPAWQADIFKTAMHRTCGVAYGDANKRRKIIDSSFEFVIINYNGTGIVLEELRKGGFDLIIVDEANAYKNTNTKLWKTLAKLLAPSTWLWMLTGTPASQSPQDAFGLARLVSPERVPRYVTAWRDRVMKQISRFRWVPKHTASQDVFSVLQPAIRYTKKECVDLPPVTYQTRDVPLTPQAAKYYNLLKKEMYIEAVGEPISAVHAAANMTKLLQIASGAVYTDGKDVVEFDVTPRLQALKEVLDETSNKAIVFVPYLNVLPVISTYLNDIGVTHELIHGDVTVRQRAEILSRLQTQTNPKVLLIQPQSASHGLTATAADTIVFWGPVMSVETYIQCVGRIDRLGQKNKMTVVHLQGSQVERTRYDILRGNVDKHLSIVDLYKRVLDKKE